MSFDKDINQTITSAVNAKIEGAVIQALASDDVIRAYVSAALREPVEVDRWSNKKDTYLGSIIKKAVQEQTQAVVAEEIGATEEAIRKEVRKALSKSIGVITDSLVSGFVENTRGSYPNIEVSFHERDL